MGVLLALCRHVYRRGWGGGIRHGANTRHNICPSVNVDRKSFVEYRIDFVSVGPENDALTGFLFSYPAELRIFSERSIPTVFAGQLMPCRSVYQWGITGNRWGMLGRLTAFETIRQYGKRCSVIHVSVVEPRVVQFCIFKFKLRLCLRDSKTVVKLN